MRKLRVLTPTFVAAVVIVILGLTLRLFGLGRKSIWYDEAVSVGIAEAGFDQILTASASDVNPPLYYALLHIWRPLAADDFLVRLPSAVLSAAAVAATIALGTSLLGRRMGLLAGLLTAISAFHIDQGQEARAYGLLSLLAVASLWTLHEAWKRRTWSWWLAFAIVTTMALYTHNYAVFLVAAEGIWLVVAMATARHWDPRAAVGFAGGVGAFLPWIPVALAQIQGVTTTDYWIRPPDLATLWDTYRSLIAYSPPWHGWATDPISRVVRWGILALIVASTIVALRRGTFRLAVLAIFVPLFGALAVSLTIAPIYVPRYVAFLVPVFWLVILAPLQFIARVPRLGIVVLLVAISVINLPALYLDSFYSRPDLREAAGIVRANSESTDLVIHTNEFTEYPFAHYNRGRPRQVLLPEGDKPALRAAVTHAPRFWYVVTYDVERQADAQLLAAARAHQYLGESVILERYSGLGYHLFLVSGESREA